MVTNYLVSMRDDVISAPFSYYKLLVTIYFPDDAINYVPPDGRDLPDRISPSQYEAVQEILRLMPYLFGFYHNNKDR